MLHNQLSNWDGHSSKGQAAYDETFEREMREADAINPDHLDQDVANARYYEADVIDKATGQEILHSILAYPSESNEGIVKRINSNLLSRITILKLHK